MNFTDTQGIEREISHKEMDDVYGALSLLMVNLQQEHIAEYFKRPMHDRDAYAIFKNATGRVRELLEEVAIADKSYAEVHGLVFDADSMTFKAI
jgi:hypothetical protein